MDGTVVNPLGMAEIAALVGVPLATVRTWRKRGELPAPTWVVSGTPMWSTDLVLQWTQTNRLPRKHRSVGQILNDSRSSAGTDVRTRRRTNRR